MNTQNYTQKTVEAIQNAQNIARENDNQSLVPEHLLYSLLDQDGGLIPFSQITCLPCDRARRAWA